MRPDQGLGWFYHKGTVPPERPRLHSSRVGHRDQPQHVDVQQLDEMPAYERPETTPVAPPALGAYWLSTRPYLGDRYPFFSCGKSVLGLNRSSKH